MKSWILFAITFFLPAISAICQPAATHSPTGNTQSLDSILAIVRRTMQKGKYDSAVFYVDKGLALTDYEGADSFKLKFYLEKANIVMVRGDKKTGLHLLLTRAAPLINKNTAYRQLDRYNNLAGTCYRTLLQYDSAFYYFRENERLNTIHDPYWNWLAYYQMALTYMLLGLPMEAEQYFWKSYQLSKTKGIRSDHGVLLNEFAGFFSKQNMPDKFARIMGEYHELMRSAKKDFSLDPIHHMLFVDYSQMSFEARVQFMETVKRSLLNNGDTFNAAYANNYLARFYEEEKMPGQAYSYIRDNLTRFPAYPEYQYINRIAAYRLLKKMNRHEEAVKVADALLKLKDSMATVQQRDKIMELEAKYQSERQEKEIAVLNTQNALNEATLLHELELKKRLQMENALKDSAFIHERNYSILLANENALKDAQLQKEQELKAALNRENNLIAGQNQLKEAELYKEKKAKALLLAGALLLLFSAVTILYLYRKQRLKNQVIQKQADELEVLMKEIHHRVKNNMQIVSSLLDLQSNTITDNQAAEAVKEGKNRVQSMAIIHQHLYQEGNIRGIKMDDYISTLTQNIFSSYNINPDKVTLETNIEKLNLDVDTVIPLGLIINELVSNSLKYAFAGNNKGIVSISLREKDNCLELLVKDNGKGFPSGLNVNRTRSFGLQLITAFSHKLKARLDFYNDNGAAVQMVIKKFRLASI